MSRRIVAVICCVIFMAIMIWDCYLYADGQPENSISQMIIYYSGKSHLVPAFVGFMLGALMFHFFDNSKQGE